MPHIRNMPEGFPLRTQDPFPPNVLHKSTETQRLSCIISILILETHRERTVRRGVAQHQSVYIQGFVQHYGVLENAVMAITPLKQPPRTLVQHQVRCIN